jgi:hypothetical protein
VIMSGDPDRPPEVANSEYTPEIPCAGCGHTFLSKPGVFLCSACRGRRIPIAKIARAKLVQLGLPGMPPKLP